MKFEDYIPLAMETAVFTDLRYPVYSLSIEVHEFLDVLVKPMYRGDNHGRVDRDQLIKEAGDVCWMIAAVVDKFIRNNGGVIVDWEGHTVPDYVNDHSVMSWITVTASLAFREAMFSDEGELDTRVDPVMLGATLVSLLVLVSWVLRRHDITLDQVLETNLAKLRDRQARGVLMGSGGER